MSEAITWVTSHPGRLWIAVADFSGRLLVWAPGDNRIVARQKLPARIRRVEWTSDGERLVAIEEGSDSLHVFSTDGASVVRTIATGHEDVSGLAVHPSKPWAATAGADSHLRVWDLETGSAIFEHV
jgi:WD40 repeat protein